MAYEVFLCMRRTDLGNGVLQVTDLKSTSQRNFPYQKVGQTKYINRVQNSTVRTQGSGPITTRAEYSGVAAYLIDNVESGGLSTGVLALTATQANTIATNLIARLDAGSSLTLEAVNTVISATVSNTELTNRGGSASRGVLTELLSIMAGAEYVLPSGSAIESASNVFASTRLGAFTSAQYRNTYDTGDFRLSLQEGDLSQMRSSTFSTLGTTGAAVVVYDRQGNVLPATSDFQAGLDSGYPPVGYFYMTGVSVDTQTVTIGGRVYEFDADATYTAGNVPVDISGGTGAVASITALVTAINADTSRVVNAVAMTGNGASGSGCLFVARSVAAAEIAMSDTCANGAVSASFTTGGEAPKVTSFYTGTYTAVASDVTVWANAAANEVVVGSVASTTQPKLTGFIAQTSAGALMPVNTIVCTWKQANSAYWLLVVEDPSAVLSATDVLTWTAII